MTATMFAAVVYCIAGLAVMVGLAAWFDPRFCAWFAARLMARREVILSSRIAWSDGLSHWTDEFAPGPELMKRDRP